MRGVVDAVDSGVLARARCCGEASSPAAGGEVWWSWARGGRLDEDEGCGSLDVDCTVEEKVTNVRKKWTIDLNN